MKYANERKTALAAVKSAGEICARIRSEMLGGTMFKGDSSPVTVADFCSQAIVCKIIKDAFPDLPIVAEEDAKALKLPENDRNREEVVRYVREKYPDAGEEEVLDWIDLGEGEAGPRFWTLDPIDGTKGFLRGDQYAIALALIENGEIKVGALACPNLPLSFGEQSEPGKNGVIFVAVRGEGACMLEPGRRGEEKILVAETGDTSSAIIVESFESGHSDHDGQSGVAGLLGIRKTSLRMDSQAKYGTVARGEADIYLRMPSPKTPDYREKIWDHAAGALIVEEAGGKVTDIKGNALDFSAGKKLQNNSGVVVTNGKLHDRVIAAISSRINIPL